MTDVNARFAGSIPATYDRCLGPLLFEPSARDFAARWPWTTYGTVLELAAGTGILTRQLRAAMAPGAELVATDLNPDMLALAQAKHTGAAVRWQQADAQALPFDDASFDAVACQYGVMFFPDKAGALRQVRRVLRPGGFFGFSVWDSLAANPLGAIAKETVNRYFTSDPPTFFDVPFGFPDPTMWQALLTAAGFGEFTVALLPMVNESPSAAIAAEGIIGGNPTLTAIQERATAPAAEIIGAAARAMAERFGDAPSRVPMQAVVMSARAV